MVDVKQAVHAATVYIQDLYAAPLPGLRLEEVELSDDERRWLITMGFLEDEADAPTQQPHNALEALALARPQGTERRVYKQIEIDAATGQPRAMRIRQV